MEDRKIETPKRVLARLVADELEAVQGGMPAQFTFSGTSTAGGGAVATDGYQDRDDL
jgi:hypothetical protein